MKIQLTDKERLFLVNQHKILSFLDKDNSEYHSRLVNQLKDGHIWLYEQSCEHILEIFSEEDSNFVLNILSIYQMLQDAYRHSVVDKTIVSENEITFPGFDGNNETEYKSFVDALYEDERYFGIIKKESTNSHCPMIPRYSTMISKWVNFGKPHSFTCDQVLEILEK